MMKPLKQIRTKVRRQLDKTFKHEAFNNKLSKRNAEEAIGEELGLNATA